MDTGELEDLRPMILGICEDFFASASPSKERPASQGDLYVGQRLQREAQGS